MSDKPGCLSGLLKLFILDWIFDRLQERFGFGRRNSCIGMGCGFILLCLFVALACSVITNTDWLRLFNVLPLR